ncbi:hypothetical protein ACFE04_017429 [Oxalis oulophora]
MAAQKLKVIDEFRVSPPPGSLPDTLTLPLTIFDLTYLNSIHRFTFKSLFLYANPDQSLDHFTQTTIPSLKSSLSLTLRYFFPYASDIILPPAPQKPYILFTQGNSVSFIVAQYDGDHSDFDHLTSNNIKDVNDLHTFCPNLPRNHVSPDGTRVDPLFVVKVTLFPGQGICIGIGYSHTIADGRTMKHFLKSWTSICRSNDKWHDSTLSSQELETPDLHADKVRSTFVMKRSHIDKLKRYISNSFPNEEAHLSSLIITCCFIWVCLVKSIGTISDDMICRLSVPADMRNHIKGIPTTYFGNCIAGVFANVKKSKLVAQDGLIVAARALQKSLKELKISHGVLRVIEKWITTDDKNLLLIVAGSPRFEIYKNDFDWGYPKKRELLHIDAPHIRTMSLAECRDEEGGIEIGMELKGAEMDVFTRVFYQGLTTSLL